MAFQYQYTPNKKIADVYNSLLPGSVPPPGPGPKLTLPMTLQNILAGGSPVPLTPVTRNLPNNGGSYTAPVVAQPSKPTPPPVPPALDYSKYTNPVTGKVMNPQEYADFLATQKANGSVPTYAGDALTGKVNTTADLQKRGYDINNQRNDIATGTTDPYGVASKSGIAYSPAELNAIEKAYAGIYDPVLNDVFTKLDAKQKEDAAALTLKNQLTLEAQKHKNDLELKQTRSGDSLALGGGASSTGGYVEGENPIVDSWVQRISRGEAKIEQITGTKNQGLRDLVNAGLNTLKYRNGTTSGSLDTVNTINQLLANPDLNNISGFIGQTGITSLFGQAKTAKTQYENILGAVQLAKAGSIKGQGQISDYERSVLKQASAAIDRGQSDPEFRDALVRLRGAMMTASGLEAPIRVTSPSGETVDSTGDTQTINELISEGNVVTYTEK